MTSEKIKKLKFIGLLSPPVNGMSLVTEFMLQQFAEVCELAVVGISKKENQTQLNFLISKGFKILYTCLLDLINFRERYDYLYIAANSRNGLFYDILLILLARVKHAQVLYHHHTYNYLSHYDWRMQVIGWLLGHTDTQIFLCNKMRDDFGAKYICKSEFLVIGNSLVVKNQIDVDRESHLNCHLSINNKIKIGHISNLSVEKGFDVVLEVFEQLVELGVSVHLIVAGPFVSNYEEKLFGRIQGKYPHLIDYRGPVYGRQKQEFFHDIDLLLFPSRYKSEAYPLVILEALAENIPVITAARGCIESMLPGDFVVCQTEDYIRIAVSAIEHWSHDKNSYDDAVDLAQTRWEQCLLKDALELDHLLMTLKEF